MQVEKGNNHYYKIGNKYIKTMTSEEEWATNVLPIQLNGYLYKTTNTEEIKNFERKLNEIKNNNTAFERGENYKTFISPFFRYDSEGYIYEASILYGWALVQESWIIE